MLKWLGNKNYTFKQTGSSDEDYGLGIGFIRINEALKGISLKDYPAKAFESKIYIDYPTKSPVCVDLIETETVYDLVFQLRNILIALLQDRGETGVSEYIKLGDLYMDKFVICSKTGDIIVYIKNINEDD